MGVLIKINHKALVQLLRTGIITNDLITFNEVFYSDGVCIKQQCPRSRYKLEDIEGIEVE